MNDGINYQFSVSELGLLPNGDEVIQDIIGSFKFDINDYDFSFSSGYNNLTFDEKQYLINSIPFFHSWFVNDRTVVINQCGKTSINGKNAYVYDLSYLSKDDENTRKVYVYYPDDKSNIISDQAYNELVSSDNEYNAEAINQVWQDYLNQL